ncbi:MAG: efflux RND transporter permease subunit [Bdellovibrio sp.]|jgi:multidrug efflux pump subunit AcrB
MLNRRISYFVTTVLVFLGIIAFFQMPREEDPRIKKRNALARVILPGATPERIFRQVVRPLEDELSKVEELKEVSVEVRLNVAIFQLELVDDVKDIPLAWREVENAIERSRSLVESSVRLPVLEFGVLDIESVILAVTGGTYPEMIDASQRLKDELLRNAQVAEVRLFGSPTLEIRTEVNEQKMFGLGLGILQLVDGLQQKNSGAPTGFLLNSGDRVVIDQTNDLSQISQLENLKFETRNFTSVKLKDFSVSRRLEADPPQNIFRLNGVPAIGIGIVAKEGLNIESFGQRILDAMSSYSKSLQPLKLEMVAYQPERTKERISNLMVALVSGMALIALLLVFLMGPTTAFLVALMVPTISLVGLFIYFMIGGVLHQISIAAFIISIGQFIDNVIVVIDQMQKRINSGESGDEAAQKVSKNLRWPMAFATLTGICAFLPMYSSQGGTADFVTALPLVAMITLVASYFVTLFFTPLLAARLIQPRASKKVDQVFEFLENLLTKMALGPFWRVGALIALIFGISIFGLIFVKKEFFPESDRNEFLFTFELNQSADISLTLNVLKEVEAYLKAKTEVTQIAAFAGGDIPRFYYNIPNFQRAPQVGQLLLTVRPGTPMKELGLDVETHFSRKYPAISFVSLFLQQGPPINAKVELRFFSTEPKRLEEASQYLSGAFKSNEKMRAVRVDEVRGLKTLVAQTKDSTAASLGLSNREVNSYLAFYSTGLPVSVFRFEREPLVVRVRAQENLNLSDQALGKSIALRGQDRDFTLGDLVDFKLQDSISVIRRKNSESYLRALADLKEGATFSDVSVDLEKIRASFPVKPGERFELGGDAEGAGEANTSILKVVPVAMSLLILCLLLEFKSYRKVLIAVLALPVAILGVFPGLWLAGVPFGFMSLLGLLALVGISVNNIILLLEALEDEGSLELAIKSRTRAIFLTTTLTLAGLIPLAFDDSSLWPPLAWTMISGLITGTVATLIVVPVLCRIFFGDRIKKTAKAVIPLVVMLSLFIQTPKAEAQSGVPLTTVLQRIGLAIETKGHEQALESEKIAESISWRKAWMPSAFIAGEAFQRRQDLMTNSSFGPMKAESKDRLDIKAEIEQKIFNKSLMGSGRQAALKNLEAEEFNTHALKVETQMKLVMMVLQVNEADVQEGFLTLQKKNLDQRLRDMTALVARGRVSKADLLRLQVLIERTDQQLEELKINQTQLRSYLEREQILFAHESFRLPKNLDSKSRGDEPALAKSWQQKSLIAKSEALIQESEKISDASWPQASVFARNIQSDGRNLVEPNFSEVGVRLYWEIPLDGLRSKQSTAVLRKRDELESKRLQLERFETTALKQQADRLNNLSQWKKKMRGLALQSLKTKKSEEAKYGEGRTSLSDLIQADNLSLELERDLQLVDLELLRTCLQIEKLKGQNLKKCDEVQ